MDGSKLGNGVYRGGEEIFRELFQQYGDTIYGMLLAKCKDQQIARSLLKDIFREVYAEIVEAGSVDITAVWLRSVAEAHLKQAQLPAGGQPAQIAAQGKPQQAAGQQRQQVPVAAPYAGQGQQAAQQPKPAGQPMQFQQAAQAAQQPKPVGQPGQFQQAQQAAQQPKPAGQPGQFQQAQQMAQQPKPAQQPMQFQQGQQMAQQPKPAGQPGQIRQAQSVQQPKAAAQQAKGQPKFLKPKLIQPLGKGKPAGAGQAVPGLIGAQGNFEPYIPSGQQPKEKQRNVGRIVLICGLSVLILMTLWLLMGLMMDMGILPEIDLGYAWFNKNVFSLF